MLTGTRRLADLGRVFAADLTEKEVAWLIDEEWAMTAEDVLWRRSKLGLRFTPAQADLLQAWMGEQRARVAAPAA